MPLVAVLAAACGPLSDDESGLGGTSGGSGIGENPGSGNSGGGGAAELLGLKPTTLHAKMKKLGIHRPRVHATA